MFLSRFCRVSVVSVVFSRFLDHVFKAGAAGRLAQSPECAKTHGKIHKHGRPGAGNKDLGPCPAAAFRHVFAGFVSHSDLAGTPIRSRNLVTSPLFPWRFCAFRIPVCIRYSRIFPPIGNSSSAYRPFRLEAPPIRSRDCGKSSNFPGRFCAFRIPVSMKSSSSGPPIVDFKGVTVHFAFASPRGSTNLEPRSGKSSIPPGVSVHFGFRLASGGVPFPLRSAIRENITVLCRPFCAGLGVPFAAGMF